MFEGYYNCSISKIRYKANQKVLKCSLTFPLKNSIVTFYENCTNKYVRVDKLGRWYPPPIGYLGHLRYNFLIAWAIITIYISICAQMDPNSYLKRHNFTPDAKGVISKRLYSPLFSLKVKW